MRFREKLIEMGACEEAVEWVGKRGFKRAWRECKRGDWMILYARFAPLPVTNEQWVKIAVLCARDVLHLVPKGEDRPRLAIEAAEAWLENPCEETREAVAVVAWVVGDASWVSAPAGYAGYASLAAKESVAAAKEAKEAAGYAAVTADASWARQADIVRSVIGEVMG